MKPVCIDFETEGIEGRPAYPPKPVGVAIKWPGKKAKYFAWGHPTENNCQIGEAVLNLKKAWEHPGGVLFHNAKFDVDVAETHMGMTRLPWNKVHDTMFLLFLNDPHSPDLQLKPSSERILGLTPTEQDAVRDWLVLNQPVKGVRISASPKGNEPYGKYICMAPGALVGYYAVGDVERTAALFDHLYPALDDGMKTAYDRERRLLPHLLSMERDGVRIDHQRLYDDVMSYGIVMGEINEWIYKTLKSVFNIDSGSKLIDALAAAGKIDLSKVPLTPTKKYATTKVALNMAVTDPQVLAILRYRTQLGTCLSTFMEPWLETAKKSGGFIYTSWHQCRSMDGGTRTGRLSSHPNFQNIPKNFAPIFATKECPTNEKGVKLPKPPWELPALPLVRSYIIPWGNKDLLLDRDYSQQEYRILAHYDADKIMQRYKDKPNMDFHDEARIMISDILGYSVDRKIVKNMGFGLLYGMGIGLLAERLGVDVGTATRIKQAYLAVVPGIKIINQEMKVLAAQKEPLRTWGGRLYHCEPPKMIDGKMRSFEYKMLNVLIQGSAADCTKEAMIRYMDAKPSNHRLLLTVHDEFLISAPDGSAMDILRDAMQSIEFDVSMMSDGKIGGNWAELSKPKSDDRKTYDEVFEKLYPRRKAK